MQHINNVMNNGKNASADASASGYNEISHVSTTVL
jgi:hypothetical protein